MTTDNPIDLKWIAGVIRRWLWLILGCTLVAAAIGFAVESGLRPEYAATTSFLVDASQQIPASDYNDLIAGERLALTYSQMLKGKTVIALVIDQLGLAETPEAVAKKLDVEPVSGTQLIRLTVTDTSPFRAAELANAFAAMFSDYIQGLQEARYGSSLRDMEAKANALQAQAAETQAKIDALNTTKLSGQKELLSLQNRLAANRAQYTMLQQSYRDMQLMAARLGGSMSIAQPARVTDLTVPSPYTATVTLFVDQVPVAGAGGQGGSTTALAGEQLAATFAQLVTAQPVLQAAIEESKATISPDDLTGKISVQGLPGTQWLRLSVVDDDASQAVSLANAVAQSFVKQIQTMLAQPYDSGLAAVQEQLDELTSQIDATQATIDSLSVTQTQTEADLIHLGDLRTEQRGDARTAELELERLRAAIHDMGGAVVIAESAQTPDKPVRSIHIVALLAMLCGVLVGLAVVFLLEYMDESLRTPDDVSQVLGLSTLAVIDHLKNKDGLIPGSNAPHSHVTEAFTLLAANLHSEDKQQRTYLVTSSIPAEGKSLVTAHLAVALARTGRKTVAIDADLRRPQLHRLFGVERGQGLTDALRTGSGAAYLRPTDIDGLQFLPSGEAPSDPVAALSSPNLAMLIAELERENDVVLIDCPSALGIADVRILARLADGVLLVVRAGHTSGRDARETVALLRQAGVPIVGTVLNAVPGRRRAYYRYYRQSGVPADAVADIAEKDRNRHAPAAQTERAGTLAHG
jgi:polysaccharide biosynthesis transport protein